MHLHFIILTIYSSLNSQNICICRSLEIFFPPPKTLNFFFQTKNTRNPKYFFSSEFLCQLYFCFVDTTFFYFLMHTFNSKSVLNSELNWLYNCIELNWTNPETYPKPPHWFERRTWIHSNLNLKNFLNKKNLYIIKKFSSFFFITSFLTFNEPSAMN